MSDLLRGASDSAAAVRWAEPSEIEHLLGRLRGAFSEPSSPDKQRFDGVDELFKSEEWERLFSD